MGLAFGDTSECTFGVAIRCHVSDFDASPHSWPLESATKSTRRAHYHCHAMYHLYRTSLLCNEGVAMGFDGKPRFAHQGLTMCDTTPRRSEWGFPTIGFERTGGISKNCCTTNSRSSGWCNYNNYEHSWNYRAWDHGTRSAATNTARDGPYYLRSDASTGIGGGALSQRRRCCLVSTETKTRWYCVRQQHSSGNQSNQTGTMNFDASCNVPSVSEDWALDDHVVNHQPPPISDRFHDFQLKGTWEPAGFKSFPIFVAPHVQPYSQALLHAANCMMESNLWLVLLEFRTSYHRREATSGNYNQEFFCVSSWFINFQEL